MKKRILLTVVMVMLGVLWTAFVISRANVPATSPVKTLPCLSGKSGCLRFPSITGENLSWKNLEMPQDFRGKLHLVIVPFDRDQQVKADTWLPIALELAKQNPDLRNYNVAIFPDMAAPLRVIARSGMNAIIPAQWHDITITAFLEDRQAFLDALAIPDTSAIQVFLLNADGEVLWRGSGEYTAEQGEELQKVIQPSS